jgi:hypothetical protein
LRTTFDHGGDVFGSMAGGLGPIEDAATKSEPFLDLAEVLEFRGQLDEASAAVADALELCERMGNLVMVARARKRLEELRSPAGR